MREILRFLVFLILTRTADRYVHVSPQVAVLHVTVAGAEIAQDLTQLRHISRCFFWAADVRAGHNFHQRHAGPVQVHEGHVRVHVMYGFACVLFEVDTFHTDIAGRAVAKFNQDFAFAHNRVVQLGNLIALRQIWVEIVLAVKSREKVDLSFQAQTCPHGLCHTFLIDDGQHAGHACVHKGHVAVRLCPKKGRRP